MRARLFPSASGATDWVHTLADSAATIGRNDDNDIVLPGALVSRYHARIDWTGVEYVVEDLHSTNGTWVNDELITAPVSLKDGDTLRFGDFRVGFAVEGAHTIKGAPSVVAAASPAGLTPRESEVLRLIAAGQTNREISQHLVLSERTVARHITNIYTKIGARSKAEATAYALRHGMT